MPVECGQRFGEVKQVGALLTQGTEALVKSVVFDLFCQRQSQVGRPESFAAAAKVQKHAKREGSEGGRHIKVVIASELQSDLGNRRETLTAAR